MTNQRTQEQLAILKLLPLLASLTLGLFSIVGQNTSEQLAIYGIVQAAALALGIGIAVSRTGRRQLAK